ncbi:MAG: hypothetical protein JWP15_1592, partial [Alphaproteobacteria bacterium]|nr:hypothetical protein [Alphaproteobacteria bacterium]
ALQSANLVYRTLLDKVSMTTMWLLLRSEGATLACSKFLAMV